MRVRGTNIALSVLSCPVIIATGGRNFVVTPEQHTSSTLTSRDPDSNVLESCNAFLQSIGAGLDFELDIQIISRCTYAPF